MENLKKFRIRQGKSQTVFAELAGIPMISLQTWERGVRKPSVENLCKIATTYNISLDYLAGLIDFPRPLFDKKEP